MQLYDFIRNELDKKNDGLPREERITKEQIGKAMGHTRGHVHHMLTGVRSMSDEDARIILVNFLDYRKSEAEKIIAEYRMEETLDKAEKAGVKPRELLRAVEEKLGELDSIIPTSWRALRDSAKKLDLWPRIVGELVELPVLGSASCGAVCDGVVRQSEALEHIFLPRDFVDEKKKCFVLLANGASMEPKIKAGDYVVVEIGNEIVPNEVMLVGYHDDCVLGYLTKKGSNYILEKENKQFESIPINSPDFRIVGTAVWSFNRLKRKR